MEPTRRAAARAPVDPRPSSEEKENAGASPLNAAFAAAYDELYDLAGAQRRRWRGDETLNTTALVHEVYLKLSRQQEGIRNPERLLAVASRAMRHVLVNYGEKRRAAKRGGNVASVPLATLGPAEDEQTSCTLEELLALDRALQRLGETSERQREVVECRFFGGLSVDETAAALEVSPATVKRDWRFARTWLYRELSAGTRGAVDVS
jgi:RNA polymerase sigma factor (TIGR02999 family)